MKYISLDIETTGLDKNNTDILQVGAIVDDLVTPVEQLPRFSAFIKYDTLRAEPYALNMHVASGLMARHFADKNKVDLNETFVRFADFLKVHYPLLTPKDKYVLAGKNLAGFDIPFLAAKTGKGSPYNIITTNPAVDEFLGRCSHRIIDPGTSFTDFFADKMVANLDTCKQRAGINNGAVTHDALDDALDVVLVVRQIANLNKYILAQIKQ